MPTRSDVNQIAARTLWAALHPEQGQGLSPQQRVTRAGKLRALEAYQPALTTDQRAEMGRLGALVRWGNATLGIMPKNSSNADMNQVAARILGEATGELPKTPAPPDLPPKNKAAVALGKLGGKRGGAARAAALTPEQRSEIAKKAAASRWKAQS